MASTLEHNWTLPPPIRALRAAFVFFTRLPVGGFPYGKEDWKWAAAHAPFVGLVLGGALGQLERALLPLGPLPAAVLVIALSMLLTGAFHEDGLADTSDALGGGYNVERVRSILKDSRIGAFGGAALVVSITGRAALLAQLNETVTFAFPLVFCAARVGPIWLMANMKYVTADEPAKSRDLSQAGLSQASVASAWLGLVSITLVRSGHFTAERVGLLIAALILVTLLTGWRYWVRARGITGDFLGATEQLCELVALAVLAWKV
jgi:adenosylcobinamide-GDP ribazoletransferase